MILMVIPESQVEISVPQLRLKFNFDSGYTKFID